MTEAKFTPGPWKLVKAPDDAVTWVVLTDRDPAIALSASKDDATLMAAAPELYEACRATIEAHSYRLLPAEGQPDWYAACLRALATARGEVPA